MPHLPSRILVMLDHCGPGDALRISFCLSMIRQHYPAAHIVLLVDEAAFPVMERARVVDKIVVSRLYAQKSASPLRVRLAKVRELVRLAVKLGVGYDLVLTLGWGTTLLNILGRLTGRRRVGYANGLPSLLSCNLGRYDHERGPVEQNLRLLAVAGLHLRAKPTLSTIHSAADVRAVQRLIEEYGLAAAAPLIVLHTGSDWACQQWVPARWAELADRLVADYAATIVFTGEAGEQEYIRGIQTLMRAPSVSLAGKTSLPQLEALLSRASTCICTGTVIYELAQAANIPTIVVAGPTRVEFEMGLKAARIPIMVNRASRELQHAISDCQATKAAVRGCLNYGCPMAELRDVQVQDVLNAIGHQGAVRVLQHRGR